MAQWRNIVAAAYCVKTLYFHYERIPPNLRCCNFLKVDIIIFENPLQKFSIFTFWLFLRGSLWAKKKSFFRGCGEKTAITRLIYGLAYHLHSIENQILVKIKLKRDTKLQKTSSRARFFSCNLGQISCLFSIFRLKSLTFNITLNNQH